MNLLILNDMMNIVCVFSSNRWEHPRNVVKCQLYQSFALSVIGRNFYSMRFKRRIYLPKYLPKYRITDTEILTEIPNYRYRNTYRITDTEILTKIPTFLLHDTFSTQVSRLGSFESCFLPFILSCSDFWPIVFLTMHVPLVTYVHDLMHGSVHLPLVRL